MFSISRVIRTQVLLLLLYDAYITSRLSLARAKQLDFDLKSGKHYIMTLKYASSTIMVRPVRVPETRNTMEFTIVGLAVITAMFVQVYNGRGEVPRSSAL